jgi:hypothetical protein
MHASTRANPAAVCVCVGGGPRGASKGGGAVSRIARVMQVGARALDEKVGCGTD